MRDTDAPDWHIGNRVMCDFVHRGKIHLKPPVWTPPSLSVAGMVAIDQAVAKAEAMKQWTLDASAYPLPAPARVIGHVAMWDLERWPPWSGP